MIVTLFSTRVMDRPGTFVAGVKAVVDVWVRVLIGAKRHPFRYVKSQKWRRQRVITRVSHVLDNPTVDIAFLPINQAAGSRMTQYPVVYVALDKKLSAELFPEWKAHGVVICFIHWGCCWYTIETVYWPIGPWSHGVGNTCKIIVVSKRITPN